MNRVLQITAWVFVAAMVGIGLLIYPTYAEGQRVAAFSKVAEARPPLAATDVEKLLGPPNRIEHTDSTGLTADAYYYQNGGRDLKVVFFNGVVFHTETVAALKS